MKREVNYGNWVSKTMLRMFYLITAVVVLAAAVCFAGVSASWNRTLVTVLRVFFSVLAVLMISASWYFTVCHRLFSYSGRERIQERIVDYVVAHLNVPGKGVQILDIGCGSGVISIKTAKKFPDARVTGVDYWGSGWDYARQQCESNAALEGVGGQITFQKGDAGHLDFADETFDSAISNFVFHEVQTQPDKRQVVREALRVIKKGGVFSFHDLFQDRALYGDINELVRELEAEGITEIHYVPTVEVLKIPKILRTRPMIGCIGLLYGVK